MQLVFILVLTGTATRQTGPAPQVVVLLPAARLERAAVVVVVVLPEQEALQQVVEALHIMHARELAATANNIPIDAPVPLVW